MNDNEFLGLALMWASSLTVSAIIIHFIIRSLAGL